MVTGLINSTDEAAFLEKSRCRLLQEAPPPTPHPQPHPSTPHIHPGCIAGNCGTCMCCMSRALLVTTMSHLILKSPEMSLAVEDDPPPTTTTSFPLNLRVFLSVGYTFSHRGFTHAHTHARMRGRTAALVYVTYRISVAAVKSPAQGLLNFLSPPPPLHQHKSQRPPS